MDFKLHKNIFIGFFRAGILGYGGGPSAIPLVHAEVVGRYKWMNDEEFSDVLALANTLPGPIATKMAGYIGYRLAGIAGMITATIATVVPTVLLLIVLMGFLATYKESPVVKGMTQAVTPVVGVMLATMTYSFFKQSKRGIGWKATIILLFGSLAAEFLQIHPAFVIAALLLYALLGKQKQRETDEQQQQPRQR